MDNFDIADLEGRIKIIKAIYADNNQTKVLSLSLKDNDDLMFISGHSKYYVEAKDYHNSNDYYDKILINSHKIDRLEKMEVRYFVGCSFNDGIVKFFDFKYLLKNNLATRKKIKTKKTTVEKETYYVMEDKYLFPKDEYFLKIDINNYRVLERNVDKQTQKEI